MQQKFYDLITVDLGKFPSKILKLPDQHY